VPKTKVIKLRVTDEEHALLARRAVSEGTTITNLVRAGVGVAQGSVGASYAARVKIVGVSGGAAL
jgi:uncharacterized protein (DUF1778 family)